MGLERSGLGTADAGLHGPETPVRLEQGLARRASGAGGKAVFRERAELTAGVAT